jgi:hypothetical protein
MRATLLFRPFGRFTLMTAYVLLPLAMIILSLWARFPRFGFGAVLGIALVIA